MWTKLTLCLYIGYDRADIAIRNQEIRCLVTSTRNDSNGWYDNGKHSVAVCNDAARLQAPVLDDRADLSPRLDPSQGMIKTLEMITWHASKCTTTIPYMYRHLLGTTDVIYLFWITKYVDMFNHQEILTTVNTIILHTVQGGVIIFHVYMHL